MKPLVMACVLIAPTLAHAADVGVDAAAYDGGAWSPYLVGAAIGVLCWLTFLVSNKAIGASSFYATLAGYLGKLIAPRHTASLSYYQKNPPRLDWGFLFVLSIILGGFLAAWSGGELRNEWLHPMWVDRFGEDSLGLRVASGFAGGLLMAFGARLAGGCTSGHGISGTLQLNPGSWLAVAAMFIGGIGTALLFYTLL